jgi:hypothetical protein
MFAERESHARYCLQEQDMTRFDAVNYITHGIAKAPGRSETRRAPGTDEDERVEKSPRAREGTKSTALNPLDPLAHFRNSRETPAIDETKIIAAILCSRMILPDDVAADPIATTVDLYERILAELRSRGHDRPGNGATTRAKPP